MKAIVLNGEEHEAAPSGVQKGAAEGSIGNDTFEASLCWGMDAS